MKSDTAFLWDESFIWGLMAYEALKKNSLSFELISSEDIKKKELSRFSMLFVPGGWASNKLKSLGDEGINEIKKFIKNGGNYFGICGGAGLATLDGLGLLGIKRKQTKDRVPSFSGRIRLRINEHQIWNGLNSADSNIFHAWWPSQFIIQDKGLKTLAVYGEAMPDAFTSDLCIGDILNTGKKWSELESIYKINLDPAKLIGEPAVVEGNYGKGKIILSLIHFDTPDDHDGYTVMKNIWEYLQGGFTNAVNFSLSQTTLCNEENHGYRNSISEELLQESLSLINLGERNFLWFQRNPLLFQWRRGVRGLEYCNLYMLIKKIAELLSHYNEDNRKSQESLNLRLSKIKELFYPFCKKAKQLLLMERLAMQNNHITYEKCDDGLIQSLRFELFSASKSYGGMYKKLINDIDRLLFDLIVIHEKKHSTKNL